MICSNRYFFVHPHLGRSSSHTMERGMAVVKSNMTTLTYRGKATFKTKKLLKSNLLNLPTEETYTPTEWMTLLPVMKKQN